MYEIVASRLEVYLTPLNTMPLFVDAMNFGLDVAASADGPLKGKVRATEMSSIEGSYEHYLLMRWGKLGVYSTGPLAPLVSFCHTDIASTDQLYPAAEAICEKCGGPSACKLQSTKAAKCKWLPRECGATDCRTQVTPSDPVYPAAKKNCNEIVSESVCNAQGGSASKCKWDPQPCAQLVQNVQIKGPSIAVVKNTTADICCDICSCTKGCIAFSLKEENGQCELKSTTAIAGAPGVTTGLLTEVPIPPASAPKPPSFFDWAMRSCGAAWLLRWG
jgi:hypothetical protein